MGNSSDKIEDGFGYRITKLKYQLPLVEFVDFIIGILDPNFNGDRDKVHFFEYIQQNEDKPILFSVYNIINDKVRTVEFVPKNQFPVVRYEKYIYELKNTYKVKNVFKNTPAFYLCIQKG